MQRRETCVDVNNDSWRVQSFCRKPGERYCYESRLKGLSQETTLVLSNTRELDKVPNTK